MNERIVVYRSQTHADLDQFISENPEMISLFLIAALFVVIGFYVLTSKPVKKWLDKY